jgi:archaellum component FlaC
MDRETAEEIKQHFDVVAGGLRGEIGGLRTEVGDLRTDIGRLDTDIGRLDTDIGRLDPDIGRLDPEIGGLRTEIGDVKRHFNVLTESLRTDIRTVAEGLEGLREESSREFGAVHEQVNEVKVMIRLSFNELDRRIQSLET